jgi:oxygen-independent coproporphyrinogen III oxidase
MSPYVGFGADAHSFDGSMRRGNVDSVQQYVSLVLAGSSAVSSEVPSVTQEERLFTGLRLTQGVRLTPTEQNRHQLAIQRFIEAGLLEAEADVVRLTARGVLLSNEVFQEFLWGGPPWSAADPLVGSYLSTARHHPRD